MVFEALCESQRRIVLAAIGVADYLSAFDDAGPGRVFQRARVRLVSQRSEQHHPTMRSEKASRTAVS